MVYFFLPLTDLLDLPDHFTWLVPEIVLPGHPDFDGRARTLLATSMCFHRVEFPPRDLEHISTLFALAVENFPEVSGEQPVPESPDFNRELPEGLNSQLKTVVELAVAVDLKQTESTNPEGNTSDELRAQISDAIDRGLEYVRQFQRAYYISRRAPISLVRREALPLVIPYGIREVVDDKGNELPFQVSTSAFLPNIETKIFDPDRDSEYTDPAYWSASVRNNFQYAYDYELKKGPFVTYFDLIREASVAYRRQGEYRTAILSIATACESLFDELLLLLEWDEESRPEESATLFETTLVDRVKRSFHPRIGGGPWDVTKPGPIGDWQENIAKVRHRVVHGGYEPCVEDVLAAFAANDGLIKFLGDTIAKHASRFPYSAISLMGNKGLKARRKNPKNIRARMSDNLAGDWEEVFARFRLSVQRTRRDSPIAIDAGLEKASVLAVLRPGEDVQWVAHDSGAGKATRIAESDIEGVTEGQIARLAELESSLPEKIGDEAISVQFEGVRVLGNPRVEWLLEYRLVPLRGVMVNGVNLDR